LSEIQKSETGKMYSGTNMLVKARLRKRKCCGAAVMQCCSPKGRKRFEVRG
jgi:hypothetical protein